MRRQRILEYEEFWLEELGEAERSLILSAKAAAETAYAPYSGFPVGAAARLRDGRILTGNNQENAAYPSGLCAERVLLFYLGGQSLIPEVEALAVCAPRSTQPIMPCGACRQVIYEYEQRSRAPWQFFFAGNSNLVFRFIKAETLLPFPFVWKPF
ncbi:MAG: cytidine deaminase [Bacteroidia bacterium]|nr:cytidine deaminase [Bacteroidia bacterium]MCX7651637.1 cytidine deaminase [Bacteroidia bacterium]MDW8415963.1 cytidine deaminase [Bacteroidia bacterium]